MGAGKSTAAEHVRRAHGLRRISFAEPLKSMLRVLGLGDHELFGPGKEMPCAKLNGRTPRYAMQTLGVEWGRTLISPTFWSDVGERRALEARDVGLPGVVFDDVRFQTEVDAIRRLGGVVVMIEGRAAQSATAWHESEKMEFEPDHRLVNDGTVESLEASVDALLAA